MTALPLNQLSGMPQLGDALDGWTNRISLTKRVQIINSGLISYIEKKLSFNGTIQPLKAEEISLKPEGQRSWQWLQIHCRLGYGAALNLDTDDIITINGVRFKVMAKLDYSRNGYIEYHVVKDYQ